MAEARPTTWLLLAALLSALAIGLTGCSSSQEGSTLSGPASQQPGSTPTASPDGPTVPGPPRSAEQFVDSVGVNLHSYYEGTPYTNFGMVARRLEELGIHHIRDNLVSNEPGEYEYLRALAARGIKSTLIMGSPENGLAGLEDLLVTLQSNLLGAVDAVEGPNELDISKYTDWPEKLTEYQAALYEGVKGNSALASIPVIGPSLAYLRHAPEAPDLSMYLDYGNIHSYPGGEPPEAVLPEWLAAARQMSGDKPIVATETGYHTAVASDGEHPPVSEAAEAVYLPRLFLDYFGTGVSRTFAYELVDEHPDSALEEPESNFGLLRNDFTPKPAFTAMRNLIAILDDPGGADFDPPPFGYAVTGNQSDLRQVLLAKRDGTYYLALWRDGSVWDTTTREEIRPGSAPVTVRFDRPPASATEFQPNVSDQPAASLPVRGRAVEVRVGTRVVIVALAPN
jgi:hypothetical protein